MNIEHFTYLLANPQKITSGDVTELDHLLQKYPYFQSARALQLKGLKNQESYRYNDALKLTAAHTTDRDILFEYITSEKFIQNEISKSILQHDTSVLDIEVFSEDISEEVSIEENEKFDKEKKKAEAILNPDLFERKVASITNLVEDEEPKSKEEKGTKPELDTDSPLEFTKNDTYSFSEWLKLTKAKPIERSKKESTTEEPQKDEKDRKFELIDKFIQERPKIIPEANSGDQSQKARISNETKNLVASYTQAPDSLMTETLAKVYLQQKNYKKAIQAYKILILKNPEKSGFFADQIRAIEKLINPEAQ
ncbi:MAG TPA: hypothetical protein VKX34_09155 [Aequorivita sp.]|nr:hypothetical protein [Aequorivita sp.]